MYKIENINIPFFSNDKVFDILINNGIIKEIRSSHSKKKTSRYAFPSFHDSHLHLKLFTHTFSQILFDADDNYDLVMKKISNKVDRFRKDEIIYGGGFARDFLDDYKDNHELDRITFQNPVILYSRDIHTFVLNSKALELIRHEDKIKYSKYIQKDHNGKETGLIFEKAETILGEYINISDRAFIRDLPKAVKKLNSYGITAVHDMDGVDTTLTKDLPIDMISFSKEIPELLSAKSGIKIFLDGSLGSLTAWMEKGEGISNYNEEEISRLLNRCEQHRLIPAVHAIGNKANRVLLDIFSQIGNNKWRIEHAQTISNESIKKVKDRYLAMQPQHLLFDIPLAKKHLSNIQHELFRFRSIIDNGGFLMFGSDCPVIYPDVLEGIYAASERIDKITDKVWQPQERITRREAIEAYTKNCAIYESANNGIIEKGKDADLVILDKDILSCKAEDLLKTKILRTYYQGNCVFDITS